MNAQDSKRLVLDFLASWDGRDIEHIMSFFTEESVYHNVPVAPITGLTGIRTIFEAFLKAFRTATLEVVATVSESGIVMAERIDRFEMNDGKRITLPVTGVFVLQQARIVRFSDYFDLVSFERQSGLKL